MNQQEVNVCPLLLFCSDYNNCHWWEDLVRTLWKKTCYHLLFHHGNIDSAGFLPLNSGERELHRSTVDSQTQLSTSDLSLLIGSDERKGEGEWEMFEWTHLSQTFKMDHFSDSWIGYHTKKRMMQMRSNCRNETTLFGGELLLLDKGRWLVDRC